jgi:hypothetical protein
MVDLGGWVALGAENLGRVMPLTSVGAQRTGHTLKWNPSLRKVTGSD